MPSSFIDTPAPVRGRKGDLQVVLQVFADVLGIDLARDAKGRKFCSRSNARQEEQLWRSDRAAAQDDFFGGERRAGFITANAIFNTFCHLVISRTVEDDTGDMRPCNDFEVWSPFGLAFEEGAVRAGPLTASRGGLEERDDTKRAATISSVVVTTRNTGGHSSVHKFTCGGKHGGTH